MQPSKSPINVIVVIIVIVIIVIIVIIIMIYPPYLLAPSCGSMHCCDSQSRLDRLGADVRNQSQLLNPAPLLHRRSVVGIMGRSCDLPGTIMCELFHSNSIHFMNINIVTSQLG